MTSYLEIIRLSFHLKNEDPDTKDTPETGWTGSSFVLQASLIFFFSLSHLLALILLFFSYLVFCMLCSAAWFIQMPHSTSCCVSTPYLLHCCLTFRSAAPTLASTVCFSSSLTSSSWGLALDQKPTSSPGYSSSLISLDFSHFPLLAHWYQVILNLTEKAGSL